MPDTFTGTGVHNDQRVAALHRLHLLDTPAEPAFDRLTRLVIRLLKVPVALVSLVDRQRQFFKSCVGLPEPWASARETPLSHSFCQYVVELGVPLIVTDAPAHPLVCTNLAIPDLHVHAYLGIPLVTHDGMVLGSLCAIDTQPRDWAPEDVALITDLAAAVITEIELRRDIIARQQAETALYESTARFSSAFHHASIGMALVGLDGQWLQVNRAVCDLFGYNEHELLTTTFQELTHPQDLDTNLAYVEHMIDGTLTTYQMEKRYIHKAGHLIWAILNISLVRDVAGKPQYFVSQIQDITVRRQQEWKNNQLIDQLGTALHERDTALQVGQQRLRRTEALYEIAETLSRTHDLPDILATVVERAAHVLPADRVVLIILEQATRRVTEQLEAGACAKYVAPLTYDELEAGLSGVAIRTGQVVVSPKDGQDARESDEVQQRRARDEAGGIVVAPLNIQGQVIGTLTAINAPEGADFVKDDADLLATLANHAAVAIDRAQLLGQLRRSASTDGLTHLLNRRAWMEQSHHLVAQACHAMRPVSVLLLDVDHFKRVNDTYGHAMGDAVLQAVCAILTRTVRRDDLVGRYGGEEFAILLPDVTADAAACAAERLRQAVAAHEIGDERQRLSVTISIGVVTSISVGADLITLLARADEALYEAKAAGRNAVRVHLLSE